MTLKLFCKYKKSEKPEAKDMPLLQVIGLPKGSTVVPGIVGLVGGGRGIKTVI